MYGRGAGGRAPGGCLPHAHKSAGDGKGANVGACSGQRSDGAHSCDTSRSIQAGDQAAEGCRGTPDHFQVSPTPAPAGAVAALRDLAPMIDLTSLPNPQRRALDIVKEVAAEKNCRPFLVGGPVRDLLLGRPVIDIDVTLEDGASTLAPSLATAISGPARSLPQFLTYKSTADALPPV